MCGEQLTPSIVTTMLVGSPPRVRGTGDAQVDHHLGERITPACAGNRFPCFLTKASLSDHPRVCGEQIPPIKIYIVDLGSPPRVRGTARIK